MTTDETNGFIWRSHQPLLQPGYPKSIWTSPNNVAMSPYTWQVLRYSAHVLYHAGIPPLHPITHPFRAVKAQSSSRPNCYDPPDLGSDEAQFREHTERLCLADTHIQSHYETSVDMR